MEKMSVAVTNLGKYNEGELVYKWLELPATEEEVEEALAAIGINEQYEEYFISDFESEIDGLNVGEYTNLEDLNALAERIEALDDDDLLAAILESETSNLEEALDIAESGDAILYHEDSLQDLAERFVEEGIFSTETLLQYVDFARLGRDLGFDGYSETDHGVLYRG